MNPPKCDESNYINFLIAAQKTFTCTEASRGQPRLDADKMPAHHDAFTRLLGRSFRPDALWNEAKQFINIYDGVLVVDDTTLDKPYSEKIELV
ncbi:MAG: IS701 family transposase, partial [Nitrososphaerales archaeon]